MPEFSGILCGKICWLCWKHARLCGNLNNLVHWLLCLSNVLQLCELLSEDPFSSLWGQIYPYFKPQMFIWEAEWAKNKTSTQDHRQKMLGKPGGLKSLVNKAACFRRYLGEKLLQNNQSLRLFLFVRIESSCFITNIGHFFLFYVENTPKMQRM